MGSTTPSVNDLRERILGTWRMLSWKRTLVPSGEQSDALGPNPFGYINYAPDGRVMVFVLKSGRPRPKGIPSPSRCRRVAPEGQHADGGRKGGSVRHAVRVCRQLHGRS